MAEIRPFRAIRYRTPPIPIGKVVTQPYDKITPAMRERYLASHPNNLVRVLRPLDNAAGLPGRSPYELAATTWRRWLEERVVSTSAEPALFAYHQRFRIPGSAEMLTRKGIVAVTRLEDYGRGVIFPHERTLSGPRQDRLELLRHTRTHFGQVFLMYSDPVCRAESVLDPATRAEEPVEVEDEYGVIHRLWTVTSPDSIRSVQEILAPEPLVIADGHHRYETALAFRDEERTRRTSGDARGFEWLMTTLVNMDSPGLVVLPTHRVLKDLPAFDPEAFLDRARSFCDVAWMPAPEALLRALPVTPDGRARFGVALGRRWCLLTVRDDVDAAALHSDLSPRQASLDVVLLHRLLLETALGVSEDAIRSERHIVYIRDGNEAMARVDAGDAQVAFLLNPTPLAEVRAIALDGGVLPQKSTDFFPKLLSGLVMYCGDN